MIRVPIVGGTVIAKAKWYCSVAMAGTQQAVLLAADVERWIGDEEMPGMCEADNDAD